MKSILQKAFCFFFLLIIAINANAQEIWSQETNFPGKARYTSGASFVIGHYGFTGCGTDGVNTFNDFYKWNQSTNSWSAIANYPGAGYTNAPVACSIEGKGYVGLGLSGSGVSTDFWQYDTIKGWTAMATFPGVGRYEASSFVVGHKAYIIGGSKGGSPYLNEVWMYDAHQNSWKQMNNCPAGNVEGMATFAIGNHGYIGGGWNNSNFLNAFWEYDTANDSWTTIANIPVSNGLGGAPESFVIGSKAYICDGWDGGSTHTLSDGYVYDTVTKAWSVFTNMGANGIERYYSVAFAIGNYGYICAGKDSLGTNLKDLWQYNPCSDSTLASINQVTQEFKEIGLFPNPSNGLMYLTYNGKEKKTQTFIITDMTGRVVLLENLELSPDKNVVIDASSLAAGLYLYRITTLDNANLTTGKFVIAK